ncbi:nose resistant to fluoxetine protein 6-like isoform X1 [Neodiprion virginianus]|uniref:nose resistant to fluoxetine protein 6-like isoform X1 n=1 Tax=Neodiprion virginianus TaxID=2961670 RepID=UPI001EE6C75B|nr:nose resistant to fluoxetine protein 6-like isoform X1 [Neodiprion virginianus]
MIGTVFMLCVSFGLTNCQVFADNNKFCYASYSESQLRSSNTLGTHRTSRTENPIYSRRAVPVSRGSSWWTDFPVLPLVFANSNTIPKGPCREQVQRYLKGLANSTLWAVQMFDASTKYPNGVLHGQTKHLGSFDQCYNLRAVLPPDEFSDMEEPDEVEGRYCLVRLRYQRKDVVPKRPQSFNLDFDPNLSVWNAIEYRGDFRRVKRHSVYLSLCVPASCSSQDVTTALTEPLKELANARQIDLDVTVKPSLCQARSDVPEDFTVGLKVFLFIVVALFVLVVASSWYDSSVYSPEKAVKGNEPRDLFLCFSARRNLRSIFDTGNIHPGLDCIHLIRFFLTAFAILAHRLMQYYGYPLVESTYLEKAYTVPFSMIVFHGPIIVDGFFGIGGLLLAYGVLHELDRRKRLDFTALILSRFLRLTPLYMLVVLFNATLMPMMGSGPYWESRVGFERDNCVKNWWTNLLYINNYVRPNEMCMFQSWYLSVDYHLYIMGLFVLWAYWHLPRRLGYPFLCGLIALGTAIPFVITYVQDQQPIFLGLPFMVEARRDPYFVGHYVKSHMRIGSYMIGVLAGAIVHDHKNATWRLPKAWSRVLFILLAIGFPIISQALAAKYFDPNSELHPFETAAYAGFHRTAYALGICSIVVLITIGDGLDFHYNFMTPRWVPPLARLAYCAYLLHNIKQIYDIGATRSPRVFSINNCLWEFVSDMVYTFGISLLLSVVVEGPIRKIEKFILTKRPSKCPAEGSNSYGIKKIN